MMVDIKFLELLNATLGLSILLIAVILIRDFRKQLQDKENRLKIPLILMGGVALKTLLYQQYRETV